MRIFCAGILALFLAAILTAPFCLGQGSAANPAQTMSPSKILNVFAYPSKGQSAEQQAKDEQGCYDSAKQQTGIDPQAPPPPGKTAEQKAAEQKAAADNTQAPKGGRVRGAARGAAGGAAVGAVAGDAGTGAAAGATAGAMKGGVQQRQATKTAKQQAAANTAAQQQKEEEQAKSAQAQKLDTFRRAFSACMDARGYSVK
jgi:hypothetical protein